MIIDYDYYYYFCFGYVLLKKYYDRLETKETNKLPGTLYVRIRCTWHLLRTPSMYHGKYKDRRVCRNNVCISTQYVIATSMNKKATTKQQKRKPSSNSSIINY